MSFGDDEEYETTHSIVDVFDVFPGPRWGGLAFVAALVVLLVALAVGGCSNKLEDPPRPGMDPHRAHCRCYRLGFDAGMAQAKAEAARIAENWPVSAVLAWARPESQPLGAPR